MRFDEPPGKWSIAGQWRQKTVNSPLPVVAYKRRLAQLPLPCLSFNPTNARTDYPRNSSLHPKRNRMDLRHYTCFAQLGAAAWPPFCGRYFSSSEFSC